MRMDLRKSKLEEAYRGSSQFKMLVDVIQNMISVHGFSPDEVREATFLAVYKYELEDPKATQASFNRIKQFIEDRNGPR